MSKKKQETPPAEEEKLPIKTTFFHEELSKEETEEEDGEEILKKSFLESEKIETVKKESFFSEELTEEERKIIAQRVTLQQQQFAAYNYREKVRKSKKIRNMFDYVTDEEIEVILKDTDQDEDEAIYRLTNPVYLCDMRKSIALKYSKEEETYAPMMTADQRTAYQQLLKKRSETLKKTTNDQAKKQYRMCSRLGLDEALEQFQNNQVDPEKAFEGWSQARIRAYQMIDQNPNSYYYRFNAPGEVQRKGQWSEPEKKMFFDRLEDVGANGQWGIFSMTIPGRVGYQCSNFYRLLVETKKINDPNYVLDARGKAHYLFDKKNADGQIQKAFRTHAKHTSDLHEEGSSSSGRARRKPAENTNKKKVEIKEEKPKEEKPKPEVKTRRQTGRTTGKRRRRDFSNSGSDSDDERSTVYDDDFSGSFTMRSARDDSESNKKRRSGRSRRPTEAALAAELEQAWELSELYPDGEAEVVEDPTCPLPNFIDPITLEQVIKPAISKYGHVMGYNSWIRCLNNWEGQRNICPLTKKPLTKRNLVILTFDNVDEYRDKIVNI
ncbi:hypothetical protein K501DRAFT_321286 [Backusella circina FSU 941]|nr:hypothetical protein K501DRAFT_321286 [Backusella circina FSU 941]